MHAQQQKKKEMMMWEALREALDEEMERGQSLRLIQGSQEQCNCGLSGAGRVVWPLISLGLQPRAEGAKGEGTVW